MRTKLEAVNARAEQADKCRAEVQSNAEAAEKAGADHLRELESTKKQLQRVLDERSELSTDLVKAREQIGVESRKSERAESNKKIVEEALARVKAELQEEIENTAAAEKKAVEVAQELSAFNRARRREEDKLKSEIKTLELEKIELEKAHVEVAQRHSTLEEERSARDETLTNELKEEKAQCRKLERELDALRTKAGESEKRAKVITELRAELQISKDE